MLYQMVVVQVVEMVHLQQLVLNIMVAVVVVLVGHNQQVQLVEKE